MGLLGATKAPSPGNATQGELFRHLPVSLCSHPGALLFLPILPLQFAPIPLAAGKCLPSVSISVKLSARNALITPDLVLRGGSSSSEPATEAYASLLQWHDAPLQFTTAGKPCITTFTFPSEASEFLGYKSKSQTVAGIETSDLSTALAVTEGVPSACW